MDRLEQLRERLGEALVAVDYDGTLAPIVARPQDAVALPAAVDAVHRLAPLVRCLAVITGRPARFVVPQLALADDSPVLVLGGYGRDRWERGEYDDPPVAPAVRAAVPVLTELVAGTGAYLEDKGGGVAVHTRRADRPAETLAALLPGVQDVARRLGLVVEPGRLVLELREPGTDKGKALLALVEAQRATAVLFAGDDLGDLAAFDAVESLRDTGVVGVTVCSGSDEVPELAARADLVVDGPAGVAEMLSGLARRADR